MSKPHSTCKTTSKARAFVCQPKITPTPQHRQAHRSRSPTRVASQLSVGTPHLQRAGSRIGHAPRQGSGRRPSAGGHCGLRSLGTWNRKPYVAGPRPASLRDMLRSRVRVRHGPVIHHVHPQHLKLEPRGLRSHGGLCPRWPCRAPVLTGGGSVPGATPPNEPESDPSLLSSLPAPPCMQGIWREGLASS